MPGRTRAGASGSTRLMKPPSISPTAASPVPSPVSAIATATFLPATRPRSTVSGRPAPEGCEASDQFVLARPGEDADRGWVSAPSFLAGQFLPHRIFPGWLGEREAARLLAYSLAAEARFMPTKLNDHGPGHLNVGRRDAVVRESRVLKDLGTFAGPLRRKE